MLGGMIWHDGVLLHNSMIVENKSSTLMCLLLPLNTLKLNWFLLFTKTDPKSNWLGPTETLVSSSAVNSLSIAWISLMFVVVSGYFFLISLLGLCSTEDMSNSKLPFLL